MADKCKACDGKGLAFSYASMSSDDPALVCSVCHGTGVEPEAHDTRARAMTADDECKMLRRLLRDADTKAEMQQHRADVAEANAADLRAAWEWWDGLIGCKETNMPLTYGEKWRALLRTGSSENPVIIGYGNDRVDAILALWRKVVPRGAQS